MRHIDRGTLTARRIIATAVVLAVASLIAACSGSAGSFAAADATGDAAAQPAEGERLGDFGAGSDAGEDEDAAADGPALGGELPNAAPIDQRIVKTGEITLEVERVASALGEVRALATDLGGYVGDSRAGTLDESATLTLRIPADRFADALIALRELGGEVVAEATQEQDVTGQIVDLEARIENLRASEASYRVLLERAERIDDVLAVQSRLDEVRMQIEQLVAQLENVSGQADLSTLTVTLIPRAEPVTTQAETWDPGAEISGAIATLVGIGQGLLTGLIWFGVVWLPILLVLAVIGLILLRGVLELRRRVPTG